MADEMQFDLVSPERKFASSTVTGVQVPGADGDMTVMANHAPTIATLRPGLLRAEGSAGEAEYLVTGGFVEISADGVTVLAERAMGRSDVTQADIDALVADATSAHNAAKEASDGNAVDETAKTLADVTAVGQALGLNA